MDLCDVVWILTAIHDGIDSQEAWVDESSLREVAVRLKIIFRKMLTSQVIPTYAVLN